MAILDWSKCPEVESIPGKVSGAWVFKDTRMPVATVFENLECGATIDEIMEWFDVTREQVVAVLEFAARSLDAPPVPVGASGKSDAHPVRPGRYRVVLYAANSVTTSPRLLQGTGCI